MSSTKIYNAKTKNYIDNTSRNRKDLDIKNAISEIYNIITEEPVRRVREKINDADLKKLKKINEFYNNFIGEEERKEIKEIKRTRDYQGKARSNMRKIINKDIEKKADRLDLKKKRLTI